MKVAEVYIEYANMAVDQSYSYLCNDFAIQKGIRVLVLFANREVTGFVVSIKEMSEEDITSLGYELHPILAIIDEQPFLNDELFALASHMAKTCVAPLISCFQTMLPSKLKPKSTNHKIKQEVWVVFDKEISLKTRKQEEALAYIMENKEVKRSEFNKMYRSQLVSLIKLGCVHLEEREASSFLGGIYEDQKLSLNHDQQNALQKMQEKQEGVFLLHGVTGSGKSEVFLHMAKEVLKQGKQVLILVPEISLTPQMVKRVKARFLEEVAIYHSGLNNQEKYEQYKLVYEHKVSIVVGTRSAIFMPFTNLGLIILDEEHDQSYKQDSTPKYHTRDIALWRGKYHHCKVLLASATPSLESYARACKNLYTLIEMPRRIYDNMPDTKLIDMQTAMHNGENYILSNQLKKAIQKRLNAHEQVILLLNRRGYAPILRCLDCGYVVKCPHCDIALNYHKDSKEMKCHVCGYSERHSFICGECGSTRIRYMGMGTQKLEEYVKECFPNANVVRMDADTTNRKNSHEKMLSIFEKNGDILLGTQMISKGLDFENVTLVGIINGDALLNRSDYRSVELTFDLLVQASGRSGRGVKPGEVLIQVYDSNHYAIQCAQKQDYRTFFKQEMRYRHLGQYPPYTYMGAMTLSHHDLNIVEQEAQRLLAMIDDVTLTILGPVSLLKIMDQHRMRILLKGKQEASIAAVIYECVKRHIALKGKAKIEVDMNPQMLD